MNFFEDIVSRNIKTGYAVCGDFCACLRLPRATFNILCDGVGSGVYANIAAITCAERLAELLRQSVPLRAACEMVAASMHRARTEEIPFAAFSVAEADADGRFTVFNYEAPEPVLVQDGIAVTLKPNVYNAGYELIGVSEGRLNVGDALFIFSDGVSQAGLGRGYGFGIGSAGVTDFINKRLRIEGMRAMPGGVAEMTRGICAGRYEDDTTITGLLCRPANELTILTGPPSKPALDKACVEDFMSSQGKKVICGSTTTDMVARELGRTVEMVGRPKQGVPPEYRIEGVDLTAEGAITLNQVCNIINEPPENLTGESVVERFCEMLRDSDVVRVIIGNAVNDAHQGLFFKQVGVKVRKAAVTALKEALEGMGKLVLERDY